VSRKRKRGEYNCYNEEFRAKIAIYSIDNGVAKAARKKFSSDLSCTISETTVWSMRDQYIKLKKQDGQELLNLPTSPQGNPLMLGSMLDGEVQDWIKKVRINGGVINIRIVMAGAEAVITKHAPSQLTRYGGHSGFVQQYVQCEL